MQANVIQNVLRASKNDRIFFFICNEQEKQLSNNEEKTFGGVEAYMTGGCIKDRELSRPIIFQ